jgi:hypothetical protein
MGSALLLALALPALPALPALMLRRRRFLQRLSMQWMKDENALAIL